METVLVIDDSSFQRKWLAQAISRLGFNVIQAANGREGLDKIADEKPSFITVDLNMPVMDGLQFLANLQPEDKDIPTIVVTSDIQTETARRCKELGAFALLNKPFDSVDLEKLITSIHEKRKGGGA